MPTPNTTPAWSRKLSELTGLELYESDNLFESMQSMADAADFSASLRTLALTLIRIANDFRLLASGPSTGLDEIRLPAVQPGSSIMPGKVNPVLAEMLDMAMFHVHGLRHDRGAGGPGRAARAERDDADHRPQPVREHAGDDRRGAAPSPRSACVGVQANREKAEGWLAKNAIVVTALNPVIGYAARGSAGERGPGAQPDHPRGGGGKGLPPATSSTATKTARCAPRRSRPR